MACHMSYSLFRVGFILEENLLNHKGHKGTHWFLDPFLCVPIGEHFVVKNDTSRTIQQMEETILKKSLDKFKERKARFETSSGIEVPRVPMPASTATELPLSAENLYRETRLPGRISLYARRPADDVSLAFLDDAPVCGLLHGGGIQ